MKLSQAAQLTQGALIGADQAFERVSTDTRSLQPGDLFVALRGDNFDAHDFLVQAREQGACAALVERATDVFDSYVQVEDARHGLGKLAAGWADQFGATRIAVTGNAGKTTVKEMIACMLGEQVLATRGNLNNDIGVPLTLLSLRAAHRFAVVELGANAPGEIAWTVSLVRPSVALVTNVTGAHLEGFGSMQGIANAKAEIFSAVADGGVAIINRDDDFAAFFAAQAGKHGLRCVHVGRDAGNDLCAQDIVLHSDRTEFVLHAAGQTYDVRIPLPGAHQVSNALMALAAVQAVGVSLETAVARLAGVAPIKGRMNLSACLGGVLVDDSYNANPGSVRVAIDWLAKQSAPRVLVLGMLGELGPDAHRIMAELGAYAQRAGLDQLVLVGEASVAAAGFAAATRAVDAAAAAAAAKAYLEAGGTVLVKGSRSARMEAVIEALRAMGETQA